MATRALFGFGLAVLAAACTSVRGGFRLAHGDRSFEPTAFSLSGEPTCRIASGGAGSCTVQERPLAVRLPVSGERLQVLYVAPFSGSLVTVYQYGNVETAGSRIATFKAGSPEPFWLADLYGFNLGPPLAANGFLYVSTTDLLAKVNADTGVVVWQHESLHKRYGRLESFGLPIIQAGNVIFPEREPRAFGHAGLWRAVVNDASGALVSVGPEGGV